mgnify:CR=1 FL=1
MGAGGASTGGGGGGVGPAGLVTKTGKTGTVKDAKKVSRRNEFRTFVKEGGVTGAIIKGITGKTPYEMNLERRQKFIKDKGLTGDDINMDTSYLGSKEGLAELKKQGYTTASDNLNTGGGNDNNNQPVIVQKNVGGKTVQTTEAKVAEDKKEATLYDPRKTKKKGMTKNILTSKQGVMKTAADYSLGKKSLLGQVV